MPYLIAIVGRPNTGKSTLFNRLTRTRKAIVDATPGVTRDRNYAEVTWEGKQFILVDTGGFESIEGDELITRMQEQTALAIEEADLIVFLMDGRGGLTSTDYAAIDRLRKVDKPIFFVANKIDGPKQEDLISDFYQIGVENIYGISAEHGYGIRDLFDDIVSNIPEKTSEEASDSEIRIAVLGRPNAGKSSLINRLLGEERMVVTEMPGTTRDSVDTILERRGRKYRLIDTAGIRKKGRVSDRLEKYSVMKALRSLEDCDVALAVLDASSGINKQDTHILGYIAESNKGIVILVNKWDLVGDGGQKKTILEEIKRVTDFVSYAPVLQVSALTGYKVNDIFRHIDLVYEQYTTRVSTGKLNQALKDILTRHEPPTKGGRRTKLYYMTQTGTRPPTFVIFANYPDAVHFSYKRYIANQIRERFPFGNSPLRFIFRLRE